MSLPFDEEEFINWRENPITSLILDDFLKNEIREAKAFWFKAAWNNGNLDPLFKTECHARVKLADELRELNYQDLEIAYQNKHAD